MKKIVCLCLWIVLMASVAEAAVKIDAKNFPDEKFRQLLLQLKENETEDIEGNSAEDGDTLTDEDIELVDKLDFAGNEIYGLSSLKGVERFTALIFLNCENNELTELDISKNVVLERLFCNKGKITALNLSGASVLRAINCSENRLTELDLSENGALAYLNCCNNEITALDLSNNPELRELRCADNPIGELDLSNNGSLFSAALPAAAEVTLPNGDNISMKDFQLWKTKDGKYQLKLSQFAGKIEGVEARRADYSEVPVDVSGGVYTFEPCDGDISVFYSIREDNTLRLSIPNNPKDIAEASSEDSSGDEEEPDEEVAEELVNLSVKLVNNTDAKIFVAIAGQSADGEEAFTKGWWNVEPGKEKTLSIGSFNSSFTFGFYATSKGGKRIWTARPDESRYAGSFWIHPKNAFESHEGEPIDGGKQVNFKQLTVSDEGKATLKFAVKK